MRNEHEINKITSEIISCAIEVHRELGPGLLESVYEVCLIEELESRGVKVVSQKKVPVVYKGKILYKDFFIDLFVEDEVVVELKAIENIQPVHEVQLVTYLKLSNNRVGLLINFNVPRLVDGIRRRVHNL